ncbi:GDP-mannose 4,6-dehydratase [Desulfotomaculum sp. 1211_IL3151]|uniref:GDP-mannose 4,6-dehydratase n=1 Tax=Desulfotomaculum sp. 1211_IL3151 TaxID=3084055 RepID=UPI002FD90E8B
MRILVTGAGGFVGIHLLRLLQGKHNLFAATRHIRTQAQANVQWLSLDITNKESISKTLEKTKPEAVIHLAAQSMVKLAWKDPAKTLDINTMGTIHLLEAMKNITPEALLITVGSSEEYGLTGKQGVPLIEEQPCLPQNPYATSKLAMGQLALQLGGRFGLKVIHMRPFNHFGPGQQIGFVVSDFASQIAAIENNLRKPFIKVGDLTAYRDFTDVRDVVKAYSFIIEQQPEPGIYNVCSGVAYSAGDILDSLLRQASVPITVEVDPKRMRPSEVPLFIGSNHKIHKATGWKPTKDFEQSILDTLNWWRSKVKQHSN